MMKRIDQTLFDDLVLADNTDEIVAAAS